ncbi:endonuclease [Labilibaculum manganireducens]|uniref:endonuclease n=1 Tax=Labilibaculum manganireducens TaxID=1940525 RepID=UPI0029F58DE8|nr:endonuclease [Labilibaculum manganireducens]
MSAQVSFGQGLEDFMNLPLSGSSYETGNFEGNNAQSWSYVNSRGDRPINGKAICFGKTDSSLKGENIPNGISSFSCKVQKEYTSTNIRQVELFINGVSVAQSEEITGLQDFIVTDINVEGIFSLEIKNISGGGKQVSLDDIQWTAYGSAPVQSSAKTITSFVIDGKAGTLNEDAHTIGVTLPESTNVTALSPVIEISDKATVLPASGASQDFTNPVTYTVTAEDGSSQEYVVAVSVEIPVVSSLLINELDCDQASTDTKEFVELYDGGAGNTSLDGYTLVLYNGSNDLSYATYDLAGQSTNAQGFFVIGSTEVANVNLSPSGFTLQNGADAVALYKAPAADFPNNTAVTTENLVDFVAYDTDDADDAGLLAGIIEGGQINENASGDMANHSIYRATDGEGGARNTTAFIAGIPTPGKSNASAGTAITVDLALSATTASEADQTIITLTATASEAVSESQTLDVNISGTGITAGDYTLSAAQFTFAAGESTASASLTIVDDADIEGTESMTVSISNPSAGIQLGTTVSAVLSIADNDSAGNDGTETSPFTINEALALSETSAEYYAYGYIVSVGTDFEAPFTNAYYISIADSQDETNFDHCLNLKLEAGANRDIWNLQDHPENLGKQIKFNGFRDTYSGHASFEGNSVIVNLSGEPTLTSVNLALSATTASEADQTIITLTATASEAVSESQTLDVNISGTGITAGDYTLSAAQFTFAAGESTASASLTIVDDADVEGTESMTVSISNPSAGIQLGTTVSASISIADNDGSTGSILANYVYLAPETNGDGSIVVNLTPKEYVQTVSPSHHMGSVKIPADYYSSAVGFNGTALREHIHTIIEAGAEAQSYSTVWNMCEDGDQNPKNASQVWQMYVEQGIAKTAHVSGSTGWNREHTWAKSHGGFGTSDGPGTDGHHLRATDAQENSVRGSRDFADEAPGYTPPKSARGDVARMIFYMATRWDMTVDDQCKETESAARHGKLSDLLKWHEEDPVDPYEVRRNNVIYGYQHNRNPFVDHPELVQYIFGEAKAQEWNGGIGTEPAKIKITGTLADFGMVKFGEESAVQTFTISANSLTENVSITSPQHFLISKDGTNYSSSLALTAADGTIAEATISVKFVPESAVSAKVTGDLKITSGENSKSMAVSGTEGDPALIPLAFLHEDFETDTHSNWILKSEIGGRNWAITEFSSNKYMQMSAYKATGKVVSWLISPELDLDAYNNEKLTFKTKNGYFQGLALEVFISTDYDGGDVSAATWQKLDAAIDERNNTAYGADFVESGDIDLSAYEGTAYIAFKYTGDGSSVTTTYQVDDVVVEGNKIPLTGSLSSNLIADLKFPFTEVGAVSEPMLYELNFDKIEGDISIQASDNYEISLDGSTYKSKLSIDQSEVSPVLITVRFAPKTAVINGSAGTITHKAKAAESLVVAVSSLASTEIADASTLGRDKTLDIVSWNLEWFGSPTMSKHASSFDEQLTAVSEKIIELDADIYAIQELVSDNVNGDFLQPLVEKLNVLAGDNVYAASMGARYSHDDSAPSTDYPAQRVCYIYNQTTVSNLGDFSMFSDLYPDTSTASIDGYTGDASSFWASGRLPYLFEAEVFINGMKENIKLVNIHAKCCQDSHSRKLADAKFLMNELNTNYSNDNLVILGDYNDYLEGSMTSGASSPYASWFETKDYFDHVITSSTNIDHITISNELYDEYQVLTNNTSEESVSISDHHPILLRLKLRSDKISKKSQTITFAELTDKTFGDPAFELVASASSGLEVNFELVSGPATLSGKELTLTGAGTVVVKAVQTGDENYEAAESVSRTFTVNKASQDIAFAELTDKTYGDPAFELAASASSGLEVNFELVSGPATLSGKELTLTGAGTVVVKAVQAGNENYEAAESVSRTFTVNKASQDIAFAELTDKTYGDPAFELVASASSGLEVNFELVSGPATLSGKELTLTGAGTVVVKAVQAGNENYEAAESVSRTFTVAGSKESQTITFAALADKTFGDPAFELAASASSGLEVSFELVSGPATLSGKELTLTGAGTVVVKAVQAGNENYEAAESVSRTFTVAGSKESQTITFAALADKTFGDPAFELAASASSGLEVNFELVSGPATLSGKELTLTGAGTVVVKAVQAGNENYEAAESVSRTFTVEKASQTITFEPIEGLVVVGEPIQLSAVSSEGLTVAFELLEGNGELNGSILTPTLPGEFKVRAHQDGNANIKSAEEFQFFTVSQPTGLKEIFEKIVKIYPNPSRDFVSIDLPDDDVIKILILNSRGQVVKTIQPREKHRININDLVSGNYFISIQTDQFIVTKRLMVVR